MHGFDPVAAGHPPGQAPVNQTDGRVLGFRGVDGQNITGMGIAVKTAVSKRGP